jgi:hypothetical protein
VPILFTAQEEDRISLPLIPLAVGALAGSALKKEKKVKAVSGYKTKKGKRVKAYLKRAG